MNCEKFKVWLEKADIASLSNDLPEKVYTHTSKCQKCKQQLSNKRDSSTSHLSSTSQADNNQEANNEIAENKLTTKKSIFAKILVFLKSNPLKTAIIVGLIALTYILPVLVFPKHALVSGNGTITRNEKQISLDKKILRIRPSDIINVKDQTAIISLETKDCIEITGTGEFTISHRIIHMKSGNTSIQFSPSILEYELNLNHASISVIGTELVLETSNLLDIILVKEGKVRWKSINSSEQGILTENQGIKVTQNAVTSINKTNY